MTNGESDRDPNIQFLHGRWTQEGKPADQAEIRGMDDSGGWGDFGNVFCEIFCEIFVVLIRGGNMDSREKYGGFFFAFLLTTGRV